MPGLFITLLLLVSACGHEELRFAIPDGGVASGTAAGDGAARFASAGASGASCTPAGIPGAPSGAGGAGLSGFDGASGVDGFGTGLGQGSSSSELSPELQYQTDADGYPAAHGQAGTSCTQGQPVDEACGNDLDEDCDGIVDEYAGLGLPCFVGCGEGVYACDVTSHAILCRGWLGCSIEVPPPCGNGFVDSGEQCDPHHPGEEPGLTCSLGCTRPTFVRCVFGGEVRDELCDAELQRCAAYIGACVPVIGRAQPRCPEIPVERSTDGHTVYPMLETEDDECWITCSSDEQCPAILSVCYMGFCAVPL